MSILSMSDREWANQKRIYQQRIETIRIPTEATPSITMGILSRIDSFFSEIKLYLAELEASKEKTESIIREFEREKALGSNETDRKRNATLALQEYQLPSGQVVNMYQIHRDVTERFIYLKSLVDVIFAKQQRLITVTGLLKLEKELLPAMNSGIDL